MGGWMLAGVLAGTSVGVWGSYWSYHTNKSIPLASQVGKLVAWIFFPGEDDIRKTLAEFQYNPMMDLAFRRPCSLCKIETTVSQPNDQPIGHCRSLLVWKHCTPNENVTNPTTTTVNYNLNSKVCVPVDGVNGFPQAGSISPNDYVKIRVFGKDKKPGYNTYNPRLFRHDSPYQRLREDSVYSWVNQYYTQQYDPFNDGVKATAPPFVPPAIEPGNWVPIGTRANGKVTSTPPDGKTVDMICWDQFGPEHDGVLDRLAGTFDTANRGTDPTLRDAVDVMAYFNFPAYEVIPTGQGKRYISLEWAPGVKNGKLIPLSQWSKTHAQQYIDKYLTTQNMALETRAQNGAPPLIVASDREAAVISLFPAK